MRPLASRPGWGIVFGTTTAVNQRGEMVFFFENSVFLPAPLGSGRLSRSGCTVRNFPLTIGF